MDETGLIEADVDKGRLHSRHHPYDLAAVDVADKASPLAAFDRQFYEHAVLEGGDPGFGGSMVDQNFDAHSPIQQEISNNCNSS